MFSSTADCHLPECCFQFSNTSGLLQPTVQCSACRRHELGGGGWFRPTEPASNDKLKYALADSVGMHRQGASDASRTVPGVGSSHVRHPGVSAK